MRNLSFLDQFSTTPGLKINGQKKYYTNFGLIISFITIVTIFALSIYYSFICLTRKYYKILERMDNNIIPNSKIFENKISFTIIDPVGNEYEDPDRLFTIDAKFWELNPSSKEDNIVNPPIISEIPLTNCTIYENPPFEIDFQRLNKLYPTSKCLDFSKLKTNLYGKYASLRG